MEKRELLNRLFFYCKATPGILSMSRCKTCLTINDGICNNSKCSNYNKERTMGNDSESNDNQTVQIMQKLHDLYADETNGLSKIAHDVGLALHPPRRKVSVLIVGNHSAGKSSFINWYIEDEIQNTSIAIESQGFTFVTSGAKKTAAPIKGESTILLYDYLNHLKKKFGKSLVGNLATVIDLIDSPGLVDGDTAYPFDVNDAIVEMANHVDLILVFLDPMGQALCSRTMQVVRSLNQHHYNKMRYYLTKADTVPSTEELMKLMVQVTQNIKENINNQHGLEIPAVWLPTHNPGLINEDGLNQIGKMCNVIENTIHQKVQDNLSQVEVDCDMIRKRINSLLQTDQNRTSQKQTHQMLANLFLFTSMIFPCFLMITILSKSISWLPYHYAKKPMTKELVRTTQSFVQSIIGSLPEGFFAWTKLVLGLFLIFFVFLQISMLIRSRTKLFNTKSKGVIHRWMYYEEVLEEVMDKRQGLFADYLHTYTNDDETYI